MGASFFAKVLLAAILSVAPLPLVPMGYAGVPDPPNYCGDDRFVGEPGVVARFFQNVFRRVVQHAPQLRSAPTRRVDDQVILGRTRARFRDVYTSGPHGWNPHPVEDSYHIVDYTMPELERYVREHAYVENAQGQRIPIDAISISPETWVQIQSQSSEAWIRRHLEERSRAEGVHYGVEPNPIGTGGMSRVYRIWRAPSANSPESERVYEVIKVPRTQDERGEPVLLEDYNRMLRRYLYSRVAAGFFATRTFFRGRRLFQEPTPLVSTAEELNQGIIRQPSLRGMTLDQMAGAVHGRPAPTSLAGDHALTPLDASAILGAWEQFMSDTHDPMIELFDRLGLYTNGMMLLNGVYEQGGSIMRSADPVGFDYNHGQNVMVLPITGDRPYPLTSPFDI